MFIIGSASACSPAQDQLPADADPVLIQTLQDLNYGKYLTTPQFKPIQRREGDWDVHRYATTELHCITGSEYFIMTRSGKEANKTVLWMDGGGSCFPGREECAKEAQFFDSIVSAGLASADESNPVRDWNFVYLPYCDGSLHMGDSEADFDGGGVVDRWHMGLKSTSAGLEMMRTLFPETEKVLISGCSAGGSGTVAATAITRLTFPVAKLYVLNISGLALLDPYSTEQFEEIKQYWNIGQIFPADCIRCNSQFAYMYSWLLDRDKALKVGFFSAYKDNTGSPSEEKKETIKSLLLHTTDTIHANNPDTFKRFLIEKEMHYLDDYTHQTVYRHACRYDI